MPGYSEAVTYHMIIAGHRNGGIAIGVFEKDTGRPVGVVFGVPGYRDGAIYIYSHLAGFLPEYRGKGLGLAVKRIQRRLALEKGYSLVKWTFDPMQSGNAYFNICKVGVVVRRFYEDYYGELMDSINRGMPSDRFEAEWWIKSRRVDEVMEGRVKGAGVDDLLASGALLATKVEFRGGAPVLSEYRLSSDSDVVLVEIPGDIDYLRRAGRRLVLDWRMKLRRVFNYYINEMGYIIVWFISFIDGGVGARRSFYVLWRRSLDPILEGRLPWR